eukprot:CAMPEP_0183336798 /NCGR_PEP_ID=MMETSP0164_2-20130417/4664_1 /TAXON_ID=221442 /ORGANISM="Coccolithus pelagicus ssp braarudi, Strain PLY182g" /LENGTH=75 /DNA_ID=CAMNT_0025506393 /DNA_START=37 /DNA_END=261 /DNA_ORIENTATION=-
MHMLMLMRMPVSWAARWCHQRAPPPDAPPDASPDLGGWLCEDALYVCRHHHPLDAQPRVVRQEVRVRVRVRVRER